MKRSMSVAILVCLMAVAGLSVSTSRASGAKTSPNPSPSASAPGEDDQGEDEQESADPGAGYTYREEGPCQGGWENIHTPGLCLHADFADDDFLDAYPDTTETYDALFLTEIVTNDAYCNGGEPGKRFSVLYVTNPDHQDRYESLKDNLREASKRADYYVWKSAQLTNGKRHIRYKCVNGDNQTIDVAKVSLGSGADDSLSDLLTALRNNGYNSDNRKYLAYTDWAELTAGGRNNNLCGRGEIHNDDSYGQSNRNNQGDQIAVVYVGANNCTNQWARTAMHEMGHAMGAVQHSAGRSTSRWHCYDEHDVMCYDDYGNEDGIVIHQGNQVSMTQPCTDTTKERRYDCQDNDYFDTNPGSGEYLRQNWNVARNQFLVGGG